MPQGQLKKLRVVRNKAGAMLADHRVRQAVASAVSMVPFQKRTKDFRGDFHLNEAMKRALFLQRQEDMRQQIMARRAKKVDDAKKKGK
jgi:hypothetical protein